MSYPDHYQNKIVFLNFNRILYINNATIKYVCIIHIIHSIIHQLYSIIYYNNEYVPTLILT